MKTINNTKRVALGALTLLGLGSLGLTHTAQAHTEWVYTTPVYTTPIYEAPIYEPGVVQYDTTQWNDTRWNNDHDSHPYSAPYSSPYVSYQPERPRDNHRLGRWYDRDHGNKKLLYGLAAGAAAALVLSH